ncbi:hypothetical protein FB565_008036 [Actinoplanes lutulentus]|uniref:Uncharacterized protein n=1 Tax=Actinoplanes lutulentus TaxID=1287878 RepID=A0A327Z6C9_9ACTN|nr:hypothetical protein [Actinoplanes lutulentus]MBB2948253.1 hypothetical protein [Actinoplanes lutulentus]RAK31249.1 hypothetical protein B0I29_11555 [Actinoplanes lutulentus]
MMIEDLIRAAQDQQAARAVPEARILAGLAVARRRRRRFVAVGAGLAATAVAAVPAVMVPALLTPAAVSPGVVSPTVSGGSSAAASPSVVADPGLPHLRLGYRPGWVPSGFAEYIRQAGAGGDDEAGPSLVRSWKKSVGTGDPYGGRSAQLDFYVRTAVEDPAGMVWSGGQKVDIGGADGWYTPAQGDQKSSLSWIVGEHTVLMLATSRLDLSKADMLRVARSVRPEPGTNPNPVTLGWLPTGWQTAGLTVSGPSAGSWRGSLYVVKQGTEVSEKDKKTPVTVNYGDLTVTVGSETDAPDGGAELTVGGRPARRPTRDDSAGRDTLYLVVDLGDNRLLTLAGEGGGLDLAQLTRIAGGITVDPSGLTWLGR